MQRQVGWERGRIVRVLIEENRCRVHGFGHQHVSVNVVGLQKLFEVQLGIVSPTPDKAGEKGHSY